MMRRVIARLSVFVLVAASLVTFGPIGGGVARSSPTNPGVIIDTFETTQTANETTASSATVVAGTILGGERDAEVILTSPFGGVDFFAFGGQAFHSQTAPAQGTTRLTYDGVDGAPTVLDPTGLGGVDLTDGGLADSFVVGVDTVDQAGGSLTITVYTDATNCSSATLALPIAAPGSDLIFLIPFGSFSTGGGCAGGATFSSAGALDVFFDGSAVNGLDVTVEVLRTGVADRGDLPAPFPTLITDSGPAHVIDGGVLLGASVDGEADGQPTAAADGDDTDGNNDDDGIAVTPGFAWSTAGGGSVDVTVSGGSGCLWAWIDFDGSGTFGAGENVLANASVSAGVQTLTFAIPGGTVIPNSFDSRFRLFPEDSGGCTVTRTPTGNALGGEVEDHLLLVFPDLAVAKDDGVTTVSPGQTITYTITVTNVGSADTTGATVTDTLPAGTTFVSATAGGTEAGGVVTWSPVSVSTAAPTILSVTVTVDDPYTGGPTITNTATATDPGDDNAANDTGTDTDTVETVDLSITKDDGLGAVAPGQTYSYSVTVTNNGTATATGVVVTDTLPADTSFVSADSGGTHAAGVVTWNIASIAAGGSVTLTVTVTVDDPYTGGGTVVNTASVTDDGSSGADTNPADNSTTDTNSVETLDLSLAKDDGLTVVSPGQTYSYSVTVTNIGTAEATGVVVTDTLPPDTSFVSADSGGTHAAGVVTWNIASIPAGGSVTLTVTVTVDSPYTGGGTVVNTASVTDDGTHGPDQNTADNTASDTNSVETVDLSITKDDGLTSVSPGQTYSYTVTVDNNGTGPATGVVVTDTIPADTSFVSADSGGTHAAGVVTWNIATIPAGGSVTLTVTVQVDSPYGGGGTVVNTASVTDDGTHGPDQNPADNTASDTNTVDQVDLEIDKTDFQTVASPGDTLTYQVKVRNNGGVAATGVVVTDTLPAGTTFVSASAGGTHAAGVVTWNIASIPAGGSVTLSVTVTVDDPYTGGPTLTNEASVTDDGASGPDANPADNTATDVDTVETVDLSVTKDDALTAVSPGDTLTYTVTVANNGTGPATGVVVTDTIPAGTTFVSADSGGTEAGGVVTWNVASIPAGASVVLTVTVTVDNPYTGGPTLTNTASATDDGTHGPDQGPADNTGTDVNTVETVDLSVTKDDGVGTAGPGDTLTYTITVTNNGTGPATGVVVTDTVPADTSFVSADSGGTEAGGVVTWNILVIPAGASVVVTLVVLIDDPYGGGGTVSNTATATDDGTHGPDQTPADNAGTDTTGVESACLDGPCTIAAGYLFTCTVVLDGAVKCYGHNGHGQLGAGLTGETRSLVPVDVVGLTGITDLAAGRDHICALRNDGALFCWGSNSSGMLGDGTNARQYAPVAVLGITNAVSVAAGEHHSCAALATGEVRCWGSNNSGQLGDGTKSRSSTPVTVVGISDAVAVAVGGQTSCALRATGGVMCWGLNNNGQVGDGTRTNQLTPVPVSSLAAGVESINAGFRHVCAVLTGGTAKCWGYNGQGGLGDGTTDRQLTPVDVVGLTDVASIDAGYDWTCAVLNDRTARCWGLNSSGQLGDGTTTRRTTPVPVVGLTNVSAISAGYNHTAARIVDCSAFAFGNNTQGQFGDGTKNNSSLPIPTLGLI